jgi:soluble lytic murein transglycosylase-like protein
MSRLLSCASICLGFALLSCDLPLIAPAHTPTPQRRELPQVAAPPGEIAPSVRLPDAPAPPLAEPEPDPALLMALSHLRSRHTGLSGAEVVELAETVVNEARAHDIDPQVVLAVIQVESGGYNFAVSHVGAMGLMQIMPQTGELLARKLGLDWNGPDTLFDPTINVKMGVAYLHELSDRFGSLSTALAAYNWGPTRIGRRIRSGSGIPSVYVGQVMKAYDERVASQHAGEARSQRSEAVSSPGLSAATSVATSAG